MATVTLSAQSFVTVAETLTFLQDQGTAGDDNDLLRHHINGVSAMILKLTGRDRIVWANGDQITEYRDGFEEPTLYLHNAPVREIVSVTLYPHWGASVSIAVPTPPSFYSDEMYFDERTGLVALKNRVFPTGPKQVAIVYEAGFYAPDLPNSGDAADSEYLELKLIALNAIARRWARWKNQTHGIASESRGDHQVSYTAEDITPEELKALRRYRRGLWA